MIILKNNPLPLFFPKLINLDRIGKPLVILHSTENGPYLPRKQTNTWKKPHRPKSKFFQSKRNQSKKSLLEEKAQKVRRHETPFTKLLKDA